MGKFLIRLGDMTTHGGKVLNGFSDYVIEGIPVAGVGHLTSCPLCKGVFPIIQGDSSLTVNGIPVSLQGHLTACGAKLISSQLERVVETGGGGGYSSFSPTKATPTKQVTDGDVKAELTNKFGSKVANNLSKSPTAMQEMKDWMQKGGTIDINPNGGSSTIFSHDGQSVGKILIDPSSDPNLTTATISHELGHSQQEIVPDTSSEASFVHSYTRGAGGEADAVMNNIKVKNEILANGGSNIGVSSDYGSQYETIYNQSQQTGDIQGARNQIGQIFETQEKTSINGQNYYEYFADHYPR